MKKLLILLITCNSLLITVFSQNLVPNPSFEEYTVCPPGSSTNISYLPTSWNINVNSSDYFNECATYNTSASVPLNANGFQYPLTGNAYCGFLGYINFFGTDKREYIGAELLSPLEQGVKYFVKFNINLSNGTACATSHIGILFTNFFWGDTIIYPAPEVNNHANFYLPEIITDTSKWITVKGSFIADSIYKYFLIGSFFDNSIIDSILYNGNYCFSYYYIDDVCISEDSLTCNNGTSVNYLSEYLPFDVYFNSINNNLIIESTLNGKANYDIYNDLGIIQKSGNINLEYQNQINLNYLKTGIYIVKINCNNKIYTKRIFKL